MFDSLEAKIIAVLVVLFIEYYTLSAVFTATAHSPHKRRLLFRALYIIYSLFIWLLLLTFWGWSRTQPASTPKAILTSLCLGTILAKLIISVIFFVGDIYRLLKFVVFRFRHVKKEIKTAEGPRLPAVNNSISRSSFLAKTSLAIGGALIGGMAYGVSNRYKYRIQRVRLPLKNLPAGFKGFRFVQISDIHSGSFDNLEDVERGIQMVLDEQPELILFTGDLVNSRATEIEPYMSAFSKLHAPMGVYATMGNHDYGDYIQWPGKEAKQQNLIRLWDNERKMGWKMLHNEHVILERGGDQIALIGVENWGRMKRFPKLGDLHKACAGMPDNIPVKILMSHDPSHWDARVRPERPDIDLTLSGHTHGMQMGVEIPWFKWSPIQYIYKEWAGLYKEGNQFLYVNRGFGFLGYQGRLGIMPEITVFELV